MCKIIVNFAGVFNKTLDDNGAERLALISVNN